MRGFQTGGGGSPLAVLVLFILSALCPFLVIPYLFLHKIAHEHADITISLGYGFIAIILLLGLAVCPIMVIAYQISPSLAQQMKADDSFYYYAYYVITAIEVVFSIWYVIKRRIKKTGH